MTDRLTEVIRDDDGRIAAIAAPPTSEFADAIEFAQRSADLAFANGAQAAADATAAAYATAGVSAGIEAGFRAAVEMVWPRAVAEGFHAGREFQYRHPNEPDPPELRGPR